jgi:hypothetical protein
MSLSKNTGKQQSSSGYESDRSSSDEELRTLAPIPMTRSRCVVPGTPPPLSDWQKQCLGSDWNDNRVNRQPNGDWPAYNMANYLEMPQNTWNTPQAPLPVPLVRPAPLPVVAPLSNKRLRELQEFDAHKPRLDSTGYELEIERLKNQNKRLRNDWRNSRNEAYNAKRNLSLLHKDFAIALDEIEVQKQQLLQVNEAYDRLEKTIDLTNDEDDNVTAFTGLWALITGQNIPPTPPTRE